jgi:septation ring formation regulator EzrA
LTAELKKAPSKEKAARSATDWALAKEKAARQATK